MLHRSFKASKCKTSLRLAMARIKLLKNKRQTQLTQMKRDLAQLLEAGQEQTARIRVEHVVREEKTMAAYDLIEIYCELIVARLPIIESQKNCPIDLKEAISSVVFASPRCADLTELLDVRKHFTAKYGKEFVSSALELRPDCGVSRTMVEKLSARAPDGQTKIKILTAIAEEHNIKWDPKSFGEKDSTLPEDLLNGPSTIENASKMHVEPPNVQLPHAPVQKHESSVNLSENNARLSQSSQSYASTGISTHNATMSATSHPEMRHSGSGIEGREFRHPISGDENAFSLNRQNWTMEFKDATSAAQAAAESAERASMAARAAAELSSGGKISRQYSRESHESSFYGFRDEGSGKSTDPRLQGEFVAKNSVTKVHDSPKNSSYDMDPRMNNQQRGENKEDNPPGVAERIHSGHGSTKRRSSRSASSGSSIASIDDDILVTNLQKADRDFQKSSNEVEDINPIWQSRKSDNGDFRDEISIKKQSSESVVEFANQQHGMKTENTDNFGEGTIKKQSSRSDSSCSRLSTSEYDDDVISNLNLQKHGNDGGEHSFIGFDKGNIQRVTEQRSSNDHSAVVFDESGSDDDCNFDVEDENNGHEPNLYFPSSGRKSPSHLSANSNTWSPRRNKSESLEEKSSVQPHLFSGLHSPYESERMMKSAVPSQSDDLLPAAFDDSDAPSSDSEEEMDKYKHRGRTESRNQPQKQNVYTRSLVSGKTDSHGSTKSSSMKKEVAGGNRKISLHSSFDDSDTEESHPNENQEKELNVRHEYSKKYGIGDLKASQPSPRQRRSQGSSDDLDQESFYSPVVEGKQQPVRSSRLSLAQEVRVKDDFGTPQLPDTAKNLEISNYSSSKSGQELNFGMLTGGLRNKGYRRPPSPISSLQAAEDTSTVDEQPIVFTTVKTSISSEARNQEAYNPKEHIKVHKESSSRTPRAYFDPDSDDAEEVFSSQTVSSKSYTGSRLSRKTKDSLAKSETGAPTSFTVGSMAPLYFDQDNNDAEEVLPSQTVSSKGYTGSRLSRRKKDSPENFETGTPTSFTVGSAAPVYLDSDSVEAQEVLPSQTVSSKDYTSSRLSRRTKDSPAKSETSSPSRFTVGSGATVTSDSGLGRKPSLKSSYATERPYKPQSQTVPSGSRENTELPRTNASVEQPPSETRSPSRFTVGSGAPVTSDSGMGRKPSLKSSYATERPSKPQSQTVPSGSRENTELPRTNASVEQPLSETRSPSRFTVGSGAPVTSDSGMGRKPFLKSSYATERPSKPQSQTVPSGSRENTELLRTNASVEQPPSKPMPESDISVPRESLKSSAVNPSNPLTKTLSSGSTESPKTPSSSGGTASRENSLKKAGHVHPKLPDYETLAAHFQSLRSNRR